VALLLICCTPCGQQQIQQIGVARCWNSVGNLSRFSDERAPGLALAALAATAAYAQSSVTVYGLVDVGYNSKDWSADGGIKAKSAGIVDGALAGNRIGFRGTEDLGGGLKADFVVEQGFSPTSASQTNIRTAASGFQIDPGSATYAGITGRSATSLNRQTFAALSGGFGAVRVGYQYTNVYEVSTLSGYMLAGEGVHGADFAHTAGNAYVGGTRANAVTYITPNMGGFVGQFQYGAGTSLQSFTHNIAAAQAPEFKAERMSLMGKYAAGPLSAAIAYTSHKNNPVADVAADGSVATVTGKLTQIGASYDFGVAKAGLTYNTGKNGRTGADERKVDAFSLTASIPFGATSVTVGYHDINEKNGLGAAVNKGNGLQIGVIHNLSKRTAAYAYWGQNDFDNANLATGGAGTNVTGAKQTDITVGVRHSF
jgi:predicted porin